VTRGEAVVVNVVKIGGDLAGKRERVQDLGQEMREGHWLLVHGGGAEVSRLTRRLGLEPRFRDGVRITSAEEMDVVDMVLSGLVNKRIVRTMRAMGINAVGLSGADGGIFSAISIAERTGEVDGSDARLARTLLSEGYLPVLCSTTMDRDGYGLNVNADPAALSVACALEADSLVYLSDIPGVMKEDKVLPILDEQDVEREIAEGVIHGGMIPKVRSSVDALKKGVRRIIIGEYAGPGSLAALLSGERGTRIVRET
jgi:acetylglutamate kinase